MPATAAANQEKTSHRFAKDQLKAIIERIERLEEEKKATSDDIRDVYAAVGDHAEMRVSREGHHQRHRRLIQECRLASADRRGPYASSS